MVDDNLANKSRPRHPSRLDLANCAILLDVDGTLLDLASSPDRVTVPAPLIATLEQLLANTKSAVALVSGRTIQDLDRLFSPLRLPAIGGHGAETRLTPGGAHARHAEPLLEGFRTEIGTIANMDSGIRIEDKGFSIAVHFRLAPRCERQILERIDETCARFPNATVEILRGKAVIELKPVRFNKGAAVIKLMEQPPFRGRRPIFFGDDITDESVFAVLPQLQGIGYSVGAPAPGARSSLASPAAVRTWLARFAREQSIKTP